MPLYYCNILKNNVSILRDCPSCPEPNTSCEARHIRNANIYQNDDISYCIQKKCYVHRNVLIDSFVEKNCKDCGYKYCNYNKSNEVEITSDKLIKMCTDTENKIKEFQETPVGSILKAVISCSSCGSFFNHTEEIECEALEKKINSHISRINEFLKITNLKCPHCKTELVSDIVLSKSLSYDLVGFVNKKLLEFSPGMLYATKGISFIGKAPENSKLLSLEVGRSGTMLAKFSDGKIMYSQKVSPLSVVRGLFKTNFEGIPDTPPVIVSLIKQCLYREINENI